MSSIRFLKYVDKTAMQTAIDAGSLTNDDIIYGKDGTVAFNRTVYNLVPTEGATDSILKLDETGRSVWEDSMLGTYGVSWKPNDSNPELTRVGNMDLHKTLPIQSGMRGCVVKMKGGINIQYYLNSDDWAWRAGIGVKITASGSNYAITDDVFTTDTYLNKSIWIDKSYTGTITAINTSTKTATFTLSSSVKTDDYYTMYLPSNLTGYDGEVMVEVPEFWIKSWDTDNRREVRISDTKIDDTWQHQAKILISPYHVSVLRLVPTNAGYLSTLSSETFVSICNTNTYCRGNSDRSNYDSYLTSDPFKTDLGKPVTNYARLEARKNCRKGGSEILSYNQYKRILYWLYVIEYANFNCQADYNSELTSEGYHQGGLGMGLTILTNGSYYNGSNAVTPNGFTNSLGNGTGIISKTINVPVSSGSSTTTAVTLQIPRWRGIENPFGDLWTNLDGIIIQPYSITHRKVYVTDEVDNYNDTDYSSYTYIGQEWKSDGYIKEWNLGSTAEMIPRSNGGSASEYKCDYHIVKSANTLDTAPSTLLVSGRFNEASKAGISFFDSSRNWTFYHGGTGYRSSAIIPDLIDTENIRDGAITTDKIANDAVTSDKIADGAVLTDAIKNGAITNAKIANGAIKSSNIANTAVGTTNIATNAVITEKIKDKAITTAKLADDSVTADKIADGAITTAMVTDSTQSKTQELINSEVKGKLDAVINTDGSVKIPTITLSGDVTGSGTTAISGTIASGAVTTDKIANSAVTNAKLANSKVTIGNKSVSLGGTLTEIPEAYLSWGGRSMNTASPIDAALIPELGANRWAFMYPSGITAEYSTDGGETWIDYGASDKQKYALTSVLAGGAYFVIGKSTDQTNFDKKKLRITFDASKGSYTYLTKFILYIQTNGSVQNYCTLSAASVTDQTNFVDIQTDSIGGWPGYHIMNLSSQILFSSWEDGNSSRKKYLRFTFGSNSATPSPTGSYYGLAIYNIFAYGGVGWTCPSYLAQYGTPYKLNYDKSVAFEGGVSATSLSSSGTLTASTIKKSGGTSAQFLKADGSVDGNSYSTTSHTHQSLLAGDTRSVATTPANYRGSTKGLHCVGLKTSSILGISSSATYQNLLGLAPWSDDSGGKAHELAFDGSSGDIHHRVGATEWEAWRKLAHTDDIPTKVSALTNDAGYLTTHQDISGKVNKTDVESTITSTSTNPVTSKAISDALDDKLDTSKVITSTGQTPTTDTVFSSKIINDIVEADYKTLNNALSNKLSLTGGTLTGELTVNAVHKNKWYASNLCRHFFGGTPTQFVIKTKIKYVSGQHMPVVRIYGYAYGLTSPIELRVGFYIYNKTLGWAGVSCTGAWKPEVYLFKYTENSAEYVAIGFKGSCYFCGFQVDAQVGAAGAFNDNFQTAGWTTAHNGSDTSVSIIPDVGTDNCIKVDYRDMATNISGKAASADTWNNKPSWVGSSKPTYSFSEITSKPTTLAGYGITDGGYTLPTASGSVLGGVKVGTGLSMDDGVLSVDENRDVKILYHASQAPSSIATTYTGMYYVLADKNISGGVTGAIIAYYNNGTAVNEMTLSAGEVRLCADGTRWKATASGWTQVKSAVNVVQATGTSTEDVISQKAVTDALGNKLSLSGGTMTGNITMNGKSVVFATDTSWTNQDREIPFASTNVGQITYYNNNSSKGLTYNPNTGALKAGSFVKRGGTSSQFLKADGSVDSNTYLTSHQDISGKVDKVDGKGLSTNDYTTTEKEKLAAIEAAANRTIVDSAISSTSTNPVTSKAISTALASKVDTVSGKGLSTNDYTTTEKTKLAGIAEGATKTTVDTALSTTSTNPVQNKVIAEALDNKADKGSQINLALTGTVDGYYAAASSIPSTVTAGTFACDQGSGTTKRCLTIVANGTIVNDVAAADGAIYLDKTNGHVYIAASGNKNAWVDGGQIKGDKGDKGADGKDGKDGVDGAQTVVQTTGTSTTDVMSQKAVTDALESAGKAPEPFIWYPGKDLSHYDITAIDHTTGTFTLSTSEHDIAVGDTVVLAPKITNWTGAWSLGSTWYSFLTSTTLRNVPGKQRGVIKSHTVTAVDGASIQCDSAIIDTTYTYTYTYWQLQKLATSNVYVELPDYYKGRSINIQIMGIRYALDSSWPFFDIQHMPITSKKGRIVPTMGDGNWGAPYLFQEASIATGRFTMVDYGVNLYGENIQMGSTTNRYVESTGTWDMSTSYYLWAWPAIMHYATQITVTPYHPLHNINVNVKMYS